MIVTDPDGDARTFAPDPRTPGKVVAWDLLAETTYDVRLEVGGEVAFDAPIGTGPVPPAVAVVPQVVVDGESHLDRLLMPFSCTSEPHLVLVDAEGRVRWYEGTRAAGTIPGFDATDGGVALLFGRSRIFEWSWDGDRLLDLHRGPDFDDYVHHTVDALDGRLAVLSTRPVPLEGGEYLVDRVMEVGPDGLEVLVDLGDVLDPVEDGNGRALPSYWAGQFPRAFDVFHTNSVDLLPDGGLLLSVKHVDTVLRFAADGTLLWGLGGSPIAPDLGRRTMVVEGPVEGHFEYQHHANLSPWGNLLLVDNDSRLFHDAKILELAFDEETLRAQVVRTWELHAQCPVQSSAYGLDDGTVVATCARTGNVYELDDPEVAPGGVRRQVQLGCEGSGVSRISINRALPMHAPR